MRVFRNCFSSCSKSKSRKGRGEIGFRATLRHQQGRGILSLYFCWYFFLEVPLERGSVHSQNHPLDHFHAIIRTRVHSGNHTIHFSYLHNHATPFHAIAQLFSQSHNFYFIFTYHAIIISFSILRCRATFYEQNSAIHAFTHAHGPPSENDPADPVEKCV